MHIRLQCCWHYYLGNDIAYIGYKQYAAWFGQQNIDLIRTLLKTWRVGHHLPPVKLLVFKAPFTLAKKWHGTGEKWHGASFFFGTARLVYIDTFNQFQQQICFSRKWHGQFYVPHGQKYTLHLRMHTPCDMSADYLGRVCNTQDLSMPSRKHGEFEKNMLHETSKGKSVRRIVLRSKGWCETEKRIIQTVLAWFVWSRTDYIFARKGRGIFM